MLVCGSQLSFNVKYADISKIKFRYRNTK